MALLRVSLLAAVLAVGACAGDRGMSTASTTTSASTVALGATLTGASEVPPVTTPARGDLQSTYDKSSRQLKWSASYDGLTGPATAAHFHGPAAPGSNAGVIVNASPGGAPANPITGSAVLTDAQAQQLLAGQWYFNIHTKANPPGEIRGQVVPK
jgi:hypothetical protein